MISIICPSRDRPNELKSALDSLNISKNGLEALVWVDDDDPQLASYKKFFEKDPSIKLFINKRVGYLRFHEMLNFLSSKAKFNWIFEFNDDAYMDNSLWFELLKDFLREFEPTKEPVVINIWGQGKTPLNLFPIVSRKFIDILGHFSLYPACDDYVRTIAAAANISYDLNGIKPKHRKYGDEKTLVDSTYHEVENDRREVKKIQRPKNNLYRSQLEEDVNKINNYKNSNPKVHIKFQNNNTIQSEMNSFEIENPKHPLDPGNSSFIPILIKILQISEGPVLQLGSNSESINIMHWLCVEAKRRLVTYENNIECYEKFKSFGYNSHEVNFVENWDNTPIENEHWGVAFVDFEPLSRRQFEIAKLAKIADYIIVHDTDEKYDSETNFSTQIFPLFKYSYHHKRGKPFTSVLSNFTDPVIDLSTI